MKKHTTFKDVPGITPSLTKQPVQATDHEVAAVVGPDTRPGYTVLFTGEFEELKNEKERLQSQLKAQQARIEGLQEQSRIRQADLNSAIASAINDNVNLDAERKTIKEKNKELNKQLQILQDSQAILQERLIQADEAERALELTREELESKDKEVKRAQGRIEELKLQIDVKNNDLSLQQHDHETSELILIGKIKNLTEEKNDLQEKLKNHEGILQHLQEENHKQRLCLEKNIENFRQSIDVLNKENEGLSEQLDTLVGFIEQKDEQIAELSEELTNKQKELTHKKEELSNKQKELTQLTARSSELADRATELEEEILVLGDAKDQEQKAKEDTQKRLLNAQKDLSEIKEKKNDLATKAENLTTTIGDLKKDLESAQKELESAQKKRESEIKQAKTDAEVYSINQQVLREQQQKDLEFQRKQQLAHQKHQGEVILGAQVAAIEDARTVNETLVGPYKDILKASIGKQRQLEKNIKELDSRGKQLESQLNAISSVSSDKNIEALMKKLKQFVILALSQIAQDIADKSQKLQSYQDSIKTQRNAITSALQQNGCNALQAEGELDKIILQINDSVETWENMYTFVDTASSAAVAGVLAVKECSCVLMESINSVSTTLLPKDPGRGLELLGVKIGEYVGNLSATITDASAAASCIYSGPSVLRSLLGGWLSKEVEKTDDLKVRLEALQNNPKVEKFEELSPEEVREARMAEERELIESFTECDVAEIYKVNADIAQEALRKTFTEYVKDLTKQASGAENIWEYESLLQQAARLQGFISDAAQLENIKNFVGQLQQLKQLNSLSNILRGINEELVDKQEKQALLQTIEAKQGQLIKMGVSIPTNAQEYIQSLEQRTAELVKLAEQAFLDICAPMPAPPESDSEAALFDISPSEYVRKLLGRAYVDTFSAELKQLSGNLNDVGLNLGEDERRKEKDAFAAEIDLEKRLTKLRDSSGEAVFPEVPVSLPKQDDDKGEELSHNAENEHNKPEVPALTV